MWCPRDRTLHAALGVLFGAALWFGPGADARAAEGAVAGERAAAERRGPAPRYGHAEHARRFDVSANCATCHRLEADGRLRFPGADDHAPCASCHADFRQRPGSTPAAGAPAPVAGHVDRFCETCHAHGDPWRPNPPRQRFSTPSAFVAVFPHDQPAHQGMDCARCHPEQGGGAPLRGADPLAPTHQLCVDCHGTVARPAMQDCGGCHRMAESAKAAAPEGRGWRVTRFDHRLHGRDVRTAQRMPDADADARGWAAFDRSTAAGVPCATCHAPATDGQMGRPKMADCDDCHDGRHAFPTTGFDCARCHGPTGAAGSGIR